MLIGFLLIEFRKTVMKGELALLSGYRHIDCVRRFNELGGFSVFPSSSTPLLSSSILVVPTLLYISGSSTP